jgi:hypothetical protein
LIPAGDPGRARHRQGQRRAAPGRDGRPTRPDATESEPRSGAGPGPLHAGRRGVSVPLGRRRPRCSARSEPRSGAGPGPLHAGRPTAGFGGDPRRSHARGGALTPCSSSGSRAR